MGGVVGRKVVLCSRVFVAVGCGLNIHYGVGWILVMLAIIEYAFIAGVYYSYSMYSMLGGLRAIMSMLAYDILLLMVLIREVNLWYCIAILVFSAEVGRTPVDLVEGESELVSGFNTEYAGGVFVRFFLGEYLSLTLFFFVLWHGMRLGLVMICILPGGFYIYRMVNLFVFLGNWDILTLLVIADITFFMVVTVCGMNVMYGVIFLLVMDLVICIYVIYLQ